MSNNDENDKPIQIRIDIDGITKVMFLIIQKKYNVERYTDTFRLIVKRCFDLEGFSQEDIENFIKTMSH